MNHGRASESQAGASYWPGAASPERDSRSNPGDAASVRHPAVES